MTEAPETQIYFITHRSGAFSVLRLRTVVRGEWVKNLAVELIGLRLEIWR